MADIEEFVVLETPPELRSGKETPSKEASPVPPEDNPPTTTPPAEENPPPAATTEETTEPSEDQQPLANQGAQEETNTEPPTTSGDMEKEETSEETPTTSATDENKETPSQTEKDEDKPKADDEEVKGTEGSADTEQKKDDEEQKDTSTTSSPAEEEQKKEDSNEEQTTEKKQDEGTGEQQEEKAEDTSVVEQQTAEEPAPPAPPAEQPATKQRAPVAISGRQIRQLLTGTELLKAKKGNKVYPRLYYITGDLLRLVWNSKRKPISKSQIPLSFITDVIPGRKTDSFKLYRGTQDEDVCFSVVYQEEGMRKVIDLVARSSDEAALWTNGLLALTGTGVSDSTAELRKKWLRTLFDEADVNGDGTLDLKEVIKMLKRLNIGISQKQLKKKFKEIDNDGNSDNKLDFDEFCRMFADFSERPELRVLFNLYCSSDDGSFMTAEDLLNFLHTEQDNESATIEYCQSIIERFEPSEGGQLSLDGFTQYIMSEDNDLFKREHSQVYQDMNQPLAHYFIASSHNTYLLEDQLSGPSSVDAYIRALKRGCRCVELDCWDGDDNEPIVYHGHTLTSKILFKDCVQAIKEHAFTTSPYPVILSIENHCSVPQQHVIAEHLESILGEMLHKTERNEDLGKLPSPEELKYKILIKAKKLPKDQEEKEDDDGEVSDEDEGAEVDQQEVEKAKSSGAPAGKATTDNPDDIPDGPEEQKPQELRKVVRSGTIKDKDDDIQKPAAKRKLSSKLSKCVNYVQSVHFKGFDESINAPFYHMSSFGESTAFKHSDTKAAHYIEYNKKHLSRIYPAGRRVDSSNYEPIDPWNCGCQIVALNYQTSGKPMDYNIGKFLQNGGCGYLLKPEEMREEYSHFNHKDMVNTQGVTPKLVSIRVISGQRLPKPEGGSKDGEIIDPYVVVEFAGVDKAEYRTRHIDDNGFNPVWNKTFSKVVSFPEMALVRFSVYDYDLLTQDDFIGQFTLPLSSMNTGYRTIKLRSTNWDVIEGATLFVEVRIQDYVGPTPKSKDKPRFVQMKKSRQYPPMKPVSFPAVDNIFRNAKLTLHTAIDIREDYYFQLMLFKDACGKSSIPDCMESISSKAHSAQVQLKLVNNGTGVYQVEVAGDNRTGVSGPLNTIMLTFNKLNSAMSIVSNLSERTAAELDEHYEDSLKHKDEFFTFTAQPTQQKKASLLKSTYSNNVRSIRNESKELRRTLAEVNKVLEKIPKFAEKFGIPVTQPTPAEEPKTTEEPKKEDTTTATTAGAAETSTNDQQQTEENKPTTTEEPSTESGDKKEMESGDKKEEESDDKKEAESGSGEPQKVED